MDKATEKTLLAVWGSPGCGKSALMAQFCKELLERASRDARFRTLYHIVGATGASQSLRGTLDRLCREIMIMVDDKRPVPHQADELRALFVELLEKVGQRYHFVLVIDAVNQMHANNFAHKLLWLPIALPKGVSIIISTLPTENQCLQNLRVRQPAPQELEVPPLDDIEVWMMIVIVIVCMLCVCVCVCVCVCFMCCLCALCMYVCVHF